MLWLYGKHLSGVVSNLKPVPKYFFMNKSLTHLDIFPFTQKKTRTRIAYEHQANGNLNKQVLSFPMCKTTKRKVTAKTTFRIILLFRQ